MTKSKKILAVLFIVFFGVVAIASHHNPRLKEDGTRWRIGYYEGGEYVDYRKTLVATVESLMEKGWIREIAIPKLAHGDKVRPIWFWLSYVLNTKYIEFVDDAFYTAEWDEEKRKTTRAEILKRLCEEKDIDLMIAMGTWAGQDLATKEHHVPTLVMSSSDAVGAGIIKSIYESGLDHINAHVEPLIYEKQVTLFYEVANFKNLGVVYEDTVTGRSYAAIDQIETVAKNKSFQITRCFADDLDHSGKMLANCIDELAAKKVDAIYLTVQGGANENTIHDLAERINKYKIPSFSQGGSHEVEAGIMMSISRQNFNEIGKFHADQIVKILSGVRPSDLSQIFVSPFAVALNLDTIAKIEFSPPLILLSAATEVYP